MKLTRNLAIALETVGCCITLAGIITEWATGADCGYAIITGGALVVTFGSMIFAKCVRRKWHDEDETKEK
ncbi:MAG: histidine kinase [Dehalococcoidales bacterium]|nr:histidine kinase [Dehalococcoidales bacterium]